MQASRFQLPAAPQTESAGERVLVTGASGKLGPYVCAALAGSGMQVIALSHRQTLPESMAPFRLRLDLADQPALRACLQQFRPATVVHLAALSDPASCQQAAEASKHLNVDTPAFIAHCCADINARLIFISTDQVFSGEQGNYHEKDSPAPVNRYGEHKLLAEQAVSAACPEQTLILRLPLMFGFTRDPAKGLQRLLTQLRDGPPLHCWREELRSPMDYSTAARGIAHAQACRHLGLLHFAGLQTLSRAELVQEIARSLGLPTTHILPVSYADHPPSHPRPRDTSLDSRQARSLGYPSPLLREMPALQRPAARIGLTPGAC